MIRCHVCQKDAFEAGALYSVKQENGEPRWYCSPHHPNMSSAEKEVRDAVDGVLGGES